MSDWTLSGLGIVTFVAIAVAARRLGVWIAHRNDTPPTLTFQPTPVGMPHDLSAGEVQIHLEGMSGEVYASGDDGPAGHPEIAFCKCGEAWFTIDGLDAHGVSVSSVDGVIVAHTGTLRCIGCGDEKPFGFRGDHPDQPAL